MRSSPLRQRTSESPPSRKPGLVGGLVRRVLLLTALPLVLTAFGLYFGVRAMLSEGAERRTQSALQQQVERVDQAVAASQADLQELATQPDFLSLIRLGLRTRSDSGNFENTRSAVLGTFNELNIAATEPAFSHVLLIDPAGTVRIASASEWEGLSIGDTPGFPALEPGSGSALAFDVRPGFPSELILLNYTDVDTAAGTPAGKLVAITDAAELETILLPLASLAATGEMYVIIPPDTTLAIAGPGLAPEVIEDRALRDQLRVGMTNAGGAGNQLPVTVPVNTTAGERRDASLLRLSSMNAGIGVAVESTAILLPLRALLPSLLLLLAATIVLVGIAVTASARGMVQPLQGLADIAHRMALGDWTRRAPASGQSAEVGAIARSLNLMADELSVLYQSDQRKVDDSSDAAAEGRSAPEQVPAPTSLDRHLANIVERLIQATSYDAASVFLVDPTGRTAVLRAAAGPAATARLGKALRVEIGPASIVGFVASNNRPQIATEGSVDPFGPKHQFLPGMRSQVCLPISSGTQVMGVLDVQSASLNAFGTEPPPILYTAVAEIGAATGNLPEAPIQVTGPEELARLFAATREISEANDEQQLMDLYARAIRPAPYPVAFLRVIGNDLEFVELADEGNVLGQTVEFPRYVKADLASLHRFLESGPVIHDVATGSAPAELQRVVEHLHLTRAAYLPTVQGGRLAALTILGAKRQRLAQADIAPYVTLTEVMAAALQKIRSGLQASQRLTELEALTSLSQAVSSFTDLDQFFETLHSRVRQLIGDFSFLVTLYDDQENRISVPYSVEDGIPVKVDPFPLGEGLTSILIRTRQPLLLVEDTERRAAELGAKMVGRPARSWMGAPMILQDRVIGALILQDPEEEHAFTPENLRFFTTLAEQVAGVINNVRLLDESMHRAVDLETAAEIARDIGGSLELSELLAKAVALIRDRFEFYHAAVFLVDTDREFASVREASGDAGDQMKRMGHRIAVGSRSIVGQVTAKGEPMVVNDTARDPIYYANPLLPATRAEAAIPLRVGGRVVGALDAQSQSVHAFTPDNVRSLQILADQLAVAVVNTELFAETQSRLARQRLLHQITTAAATGTTLQEALGGAVQGLQRTLGEDRVSILLADSDAEELQMGAFVGYPTEVADLRLPFTSGITGWVATHRQPLRVNNVAEDGRYVAASVQTRSELAVPLLYRDTVLGVLNVESDALGRYSDDDEETLSTVAGSIAAVIANARLIEQVRERAERERLLYEITGKIRRSTDVQSILDTTATELTRAMGARRATVELTSGDAPT